MGVHWKHPDNVTVGGGTYFAGEPKILWNRYGNRLAVGRFCSISRNVTFVMGGHHDVNSAMIGRQGRTRGDIVVGSDVWVGEGAVLMDGVTVGHGAVVGAYAVAASDVPPYAIVVGNPACVVRFRFPHRTVRELLRVAWWDWPWRKIRRKWGLLHGPVEKFLEEVRREAAREKPGLPDT